MAFTAEAILADDERRGQGLDLKIAQHHCHGLECGCRQRDWTASWASEIAAARVGPRAPL